MGVPIIKPIQVGELVYVPSPKHCEPITAAKPGSKCPKWSVEVAQHLLSHSEQMGQKRVATFRGMAFVAQRTNGNEWHGYPESWDRIPADIWRRWLQAGWIEKRDLSRFANLQSVAAAWRDVP